MKPPSGQSIRLACLLLNLASLCLPTPLRENRDSLLEEEKAHQTGGNLVLSKEEQQLSTKLVSLKKKEVAAAMNTGQFPPSMHFFRAKSLIDQSAVFSILKHMPKGRRCLNSCSSYSPSSCLLLPTPEQDAADLCRQAHGLGVVPAGSQEEPCISAGGRGREEEGCGLDEYTFPAIVRLV